ncbi:MAG: hypothetical protein EXS38_08955 [Opitutus sp.]|nr:hypothetical protein [Opitutus sp.]
MESVAWASGLLYEQCTLFLFAALWLHLGPDAPGRRVAAWALYGLALLTYPVALGFCPLFVLIDARERGWRWALVRGSGFVVAAAGLLLVTMLARIYVGGVWPAAPDFATFPFWQRALQTLYVWAHYLWRPWWPVGADAGGPGAAGSRVSVVARAGGALVVALARVPARRLIVALTGAGALVVLALASQRQTAIWADEATLWRAHRIEADRAQFAGAGLCPAGVELVSLG